MKDLENWYIYVFAIDRGVFTPPLLTKNPISKKKISVRDSPTDILKYIYIISKTNKLDKFLPLYKFKNWIPFLHTFKRKIYI